MDTNLLRSKLRGIGLITIRSGRKAIVNSATVKKTAKEEKSWSPAGKVLAPIRPPNPTLRRVALITLTMAAVVKVVPAAMKTRGLSPLQA